MRLVSVSDVDDNLKKLAKEDLDRVVYTQHDEQFPVFAWLPVKSEILRHSRQSHLRR